MISTLDCLNLILQFLGYFWMSEFVVESIFSLVQLSLKIDMFKILRLKSPHASNQSY